MATPRPWDRLQKSSGGGAVPQKPRRRKDCIKYKLQGECELGDKCRFAHVDKLEPDRVHTAHVAVPERLPIGLAVGRKASNLRRIMNAVGCLLTCSERSKREVKILAPSKTQLLKAKEKLEVLFSQLYLLSPSCCYLHTEGIEEIIAGKSLLEFKQYEGRMPKHIIGEQLSAMYEVHCCEVTKAKEEHDTSLEELVQLNPTSATPTSPLDSKDSLHSELDRITLGASVSTPELTPCPADQAAKTIGPNTRVRIMTEYKDDIKLQLQNALEWALKNRDQMTMERRQTLKLEARFGKLLCFNLAEDVLAAQPWGVDKFAEFIFTDANYTQLFNTEVKKANVDSLCAEITNISDAQQMLETFDIKGTAGQDRQKLDLRLKIEGGKPKAVQIKRNEVKLILLDLLCLHRQHDIRIAVSRFEILPPSEGVVPRLVKTLAFSEPGTLSLIPCADEWTIEFIRHKKRTAYVLEDKYMVTVTAIREYRTEWEKLEKGEMVTMKFEDNPELLEHFEVEFHNIMWECTFGRDVGFTPAQSLVLHTEHPAVTHQLAASIPHPWGAQDILQDYDEFLDYLDQLNESLGMVVA